MHRRIARATDVAELAAVRDELTDRFGAPPEPVDNLLRLQSLRVGLGQLGATAVVFRSGRLQVEGLKLDDAWAARLRAAQSRVVYYKQRATLVAHAAEGEPALLAWAQTIVDAVGACRAAAAGDEGGS